MTELLVRLIDRSAAGDDSKRGDVIAIHPGGHEWSEAERTNPDWIIIKVVSLLGTDAAVMLTPKLSKILSATGDPFLLRRREWALDLDAAPAPKRFAWPRTAQSVTMIRATLVSMLRQKG